jgi:hypothetical protein
VRDHPYPSAWLNPLLLMPYRPGPQQGTAGRHPARQLPAMTLAGCGLVPPVDTDDAGSRTWLPDSSLASPTSYSPGIRGGRSTFIGMDVLICTGQVALAAHATGRSDWQYAELQYLARANISLTCRCEYVAYEHAYALLNIFNRHLCWPP